MYRTLSRKSKKLILIFVSVAVIVSLILLTALIFPRGKRIFDESEYFFVYAKTSKNSRDVAGDALKVKAVGGAGTVEKFDEKYYVFVGVYGKRADAEEVSKNIKTKFESAGILPVRAKKVKSQVIKQIKRDGELFECAKLVSSLADESILLSMEFLAGKLSADEVLSRCIEYKLSLDECSKSQAGGGELYSKIHEIADRQNEYIKNFIEAFYESAKRESMVLSLAVELVKLHCDGVKNL